MGPESRCSLFSRLATACSMSEAAQAADKDRALLAGLLNLRLTRRGTFGLTGAAALSMLSFSADSWTYAATKPWQDREWFPLKQEVASAQNLHTLYGWDSPANIYDRLSSSLIGEDWNLNGQVEQLNEWYFNTFSFLDKIYQDTSGFCHAVINASAYGEPEPSRVAKTEPNTGIAIDWVVRLGALAALHSGDMQYQPGLDQLMDELVYNGRTFVIETKRSDGFWSRVVYGVGGSRGKVLATDFGRGFKEVSVEQIANAYIPVPEGETAGFDPGLLRSVPEKWNFRLNKDFARYIATSL